MEKPGGRKKHDGLIPLIGGVSIYLSVFVTSLIFLDQPIFIRLFLFSFFSNANTDSTKVCVLMALLSKGKIHYYCYRAEEKAKRKLRRKIKIEQGVELPPSRKRLKKNRMADSTNKQKIAIDCAFDNLMGEKVIRTMQRNYNYHVWCCVGYGEN